MGVKQSVKFPLFRAVMALGRAFPHAFRKSTVPACLTKIAVVQFGGIGDTIRVFPMLQALRQRYAEAEIVLISDQSPSLLQLMPPFVGKPIDCIAFDFSKGYADKRRQIQALRRRRFDVIFSPGRGDGILECAILCWMMRVPCRIGFDDGGAGWLLTHVRPFDYEESIAIQNYRLLSLVGIEDELEHFALCLPGQAQAELTVDVDRMLAVGPLVVMHPWVISHAEFRQWPVPHYIELVEALRREGFAVALLGAPSEVPESQALLAALSSDEGVFNVTGQLSLLGSLALLPKAACFVGNDSSMLHFASALQVPAVAIFGATPAKQVLGPRHGVTVLETPLPCQPCYKHQPLFAYRCDHHFACLAGVSVAAVLQAVKERVGS